MIYEGIAGQLLLAIVAVADAVSLVIYKKHSPSFFFFNETCYLARKFDGAGGGASSDVIALKPKEAEGVPEREREGRHDVAKFV